MRVTVRFPTVRRSVTVLQNGKTMRWHLIPTTYNGIGWHYHWEDALPGDYRTKREAIEAKRAAKDLP